MEMHPFEMSSNGTLQKFFIIIESNVNCKDAESGGAEAHMTVGVTRMVTVTYHQANRLPCSSFAYILEEQSRTEDVHERFDMPVAYVYCHASTHSVCHVRTHSV